MPDTQMPTVPVLNAPGTNDASFNESINSILQGIPQSTPVTATPYVVGHDASPKLPIKHNFEMSNQDRQPVNDSVQERKMARQQNNAAALGNTVKSFINRHEEKKQTELTSELTTLMKAQQQIDNAKSVLASDPNNTMAKSVLQRNTEIINSKLSNDKLRKQVEKSYDISFIDPSKNNTPEIKAAEAAQKQIKAAHAAGTIADTPEEKALAEMHANGGNPSSAAQTAQRANTTSSSPGYAEQFLNKIPSTISPNPEYQSQLAAQQQRDKQITQYVIPRLMQTIGQHEMEKLRQGNTNARAEFKGATDIYTQMIKSITSAGIADAKDATELKKQAMANYGAMSRAILRANTAIKIAEMQGIKGTVHAAKMQEQALKSFDDSINGIDKDDSELAAQLSALNGKYPAKAADINHRLHLNRLTRRQLADERQKFMIKIYGTPQASKTDEVTTGDTQGYINAGKSSNSADNSNNATEVGGDASDSTNESEDDTSTEDAAIDSFDIGNQ